MRARQWVYEQLVRGMAAARGRLRAIAWGDPSPIILRDAPLSSGESRVRVPDGSPDSSSTFSRMSDAFYVPDGDAWVATVRTRGRR